MIYSFGIVITAFLIVLLSFKRGKTAADKTVLVWFIFALIHQALAYVDASPTYQTAFPFLLGINLPLPFIHGPFLFMYVSRLTGSLPKNKNMFLLHFVPVLVFYVLLFNFFSLPANQKIFVMNHQGAGFESFVTLKFIAIIVSGLAYVILSLYKINKHQQKIKNIFSNTEKINLQWLKILTYGIALIWLVVFWGTEEQTSLSISLYISVIGFFGIRQVHIFSNTQSQPEMPLPLQNTISTEPVKYENSGLSAAKKELIEAALKKQVDEQKLYLNPDLSLDMLAKALDFNPNYVSQYINEALGLTFYDYINSKRIEEFKKKVNLAENKSLNLLGIAYDCGFNSKSSFNRNFKKITGQTPSEFLSSVKNTGSN